MRLRIVYDTDATHLTLGELSSWAEMPVSELQALERQGVIRRGPNDLFLLAETAEALATHSEAEAERLHNAYNWTFKARVYFWRRRTGRRLLRCFELQAGKMLLWIWP